MTVGPTLIGLMYIPHMIEPKLMTMNLVDKLMDNSFRKIFTKGQVSDLDHAEALVEEMFHDVEELTNDVFK